ncbi:TlpA disulfide reductase family protein [soil metagenome]
MSASRLVIGALLGALLLTGCTGEDVGLPGPTKVEVDTPKLVAMKAEAGIEDCEPGPGGGSLPDLTLPCLGGGPDVNLADLKGPLIVNVWYSNCGPCQDEMPAFQDFYADHGDQVGVLGLDVEIYPDLAISFAQTVGATYPQLADPGGEILDQADIRVPGFPQSIVLDEDGRIVHQFGPVTSEDEIVDLAEKYLEVDL